MTSASAATPASISVKSTAASTASALHSILEWSKTQPSWQRDALRRIIASGQLEAIDLQELENLCRNGSKAVQPSGAALPAVALDSSHIPATPAAAQSTCLDSIADLQLVNRLLEGQNLSFGPNLTIVYGDNGTGKSGYARVIKRACKTRGALPILLPDAFSSSATPATAANCKITLRSAGGASKVHWVDGSTDDSRLKSVFVFDAAAASHYLAGDGPCTFTPYGLDVLPKLSAACDTIAKSIRDSIKAIEEEIGVAKNVLTGSHQNTGVGSTLGKLSAASKKADLAALATLTAAEEQRLVDLTVLLGTNPKEKAQATRASKGRIETFVTALELRNTLLSSAAIGALQGFQHAARSASAAAKAFSDEWKDPGALNGTGSDRWLVLWKAARDFSKEQAYVEQNFPNVVEDAMCVLCQQPLDPAAKERLIKFEKFCSNQTQEAADKARDNFNKYAADYVDKPALATQLQTIEADLVGLSAADRDALVAQVSTLDNALIAIQEALANGNDIPPVSSVACSAKPISDLAANLEARAKTEESADDPATRAKLQAEREEIEARRWLKSVLPEAEAQIDRYQQLVSLTAQLRETRTAAITSRSGELAKELITTKFCDQFNEELAALGLMTLTAELKDVQGAKGQTHFGIRIPGAKKGVVLRDIASEGEQRCLALALFLAELSTASHQSALVFDDPVSSLDQFHRERIAKRLVKEAKTRQVIVFTHDAVFLNDLQTEAERSGCPVEFRTIHWGIAVPSSSTSKPGQVTEGLPWALKTVPDRIDKLEKMCSAIKADWSTPVPTPKQIERMGKAYNLFRATIERIVEREIFADVVFRYRTYINLKNLHKVIGFTKAEHDQVQALFKRACDITDAHDPAGGKAVPAPTPTELSADIDSLKLLIDTVKTRAKGTV